MAARSHRPTLVMALSSILWFSAACRKPSDPPMPPAPQELSGDYVALQGTWVVRRNELKGVVLPEMEGALFIFEKTRFRLGTDEGSEFFRLDESSTPKRIDFEDGRSPVVRGIYRLDHDNLVICSADPGDPRPRGFKTSLISSDVLTELKRKP